MSAVDDLRALVERVEENIARTRSRLLRDIARGGFTDLVPEDMTDTHGRPILLDAQIALLNARAVLAAHS